MTEFTEYEEEEVIELFGFNKYYHENENIIELSKFQKHMHTQWCNINMALMFDMEAKKNKTIELFRTDCFNIEQICIRSDDAAYKSYLSNYLVPRLSEMNETEFNIITHLLMFLKYLNCMLLRQELMLQ